MRVNTRDIMVYKNCPSCFEVKVILGPGLSQGWTCLRAGLVSRQDLSLGRTCPSILGPDLSRSWTCLRAGLVSGPDLSQGRTCLGAKSFRAGSVSRPEVSKSVSGPEMSQSLGPEVSCGRTWFAAGSVLELIFHGLLYCNNIGIEHPILI